MTQLVWPNFFVVGAAKAGTTSLYRYLRQHPDVYMSDLKEPHYFSRVALSAVYDSYNPLIASQDAYLKLFSDAINTTAVGEASTSYLWAEGTAKAISEVIPNARIVVMLRDPIERAYSHYLMDVQANRQPLPFYEALLEDMQREDKGWLISNLYVELGLYTERLRDYFTCFGRDQVLVVSFNDFRTNPEHVVTQTLNFLGVSEKPLVNTDQVHNPFVTPNGLLISLKRRQGLHSVWQTVVPLSVRAHVRNRYFMKRTKKPPLDRRAIALLRENYNADLNALEILLGRSVADLRGPSWHD